MWERPLAARKHACLPACLLLAHVLQSLDFRFRPPVKPAARRRAGVPSQPSQGIGGSAPPLPLRLLWAVLPVFFFFILIIFIFLLPVCQLWALSFKTDLFSLFTSRMLSRFAVRRLCQSASGISWSSMAAGMASKDAKEELFALKRVVDDLEKELSTIPAQPEKVDFRYWASQIRTPGLVESYEQAYNSVKVPQFEATELLQKSRTVFAALREQAILSVQENQAKVVSLQAELAAVEARQSRTDATIEEELAKNPALASAVKAEIENEDWTFSGVPLPAEVEKSAHH